MRILFVAPYLPSPPRFGGQRRLDGLMRELASRHEVSVLAFNKLDPYAAASLEATRDYCREVATIDEIDLESQGNKKRWLQLRSLVSRRSFEGYLARQRQDFQRRLDAMVGRDQYDIVQVEFAQMGAFDFGQRSLLVLDEHNIEYDLARRTAAGAGGVFRKVYNALNWRKLKLEERRVWRKCDGVVVTSSRDAALLADRCPPARRAVVPNGVDIQAFKPSGATPDPSRILFFGAINYFPNQDGVIHFLDSIFPKVLERRPNTKLWIVGPGARKAVHAKANHPNVEITGFVDDVNEYLDQASVVVVPLRIGGGTRLKIVEAMAKGKAIVSTRVGAEGIDIIDGVHAFLADDPDEFAERVAQLLADPALALKLGRAARELAQQSYSWGAVVSRLEAFYEDLAGIRTPTVSASGGRNA